MELQFTENRPDFWGVTFPQGKQGDAEFKVAEQVQAEEVTGDDPKTPVERHKKEDIDQLKQEVEALRAQLSALEKKKMQESAKPGPEERAREDSAREFAAIEAAARKTAEEEAAMRAVEAAAKKAKSAREEAEAERVVATKKEPPAPVEEKPAKCKPELERVPTGAEDCGFFLRSSNWPRSMIRVPSWRRQSQRYRRL